LTRALPGRSDPDNGGNPLEEMFSEQRIEWIVRILCVVLLVAAPWVAWVKTGSKRQAVFFATLGPLLYFLWRLYNAIENRYGLDSVKALAINAVLIIGSGLLWALLYSALFDRSSARAADPRGRSARGRSS
jgi:hypothetical protein